MARFSVDDDEDVGDEVTGKKRKHMAAVDAEDDPVNNDETRSFKKGSPSRSKGTEDEELAEQGEDGVIEGECEEGEEGGDEGQDTEDRCLSGGAIAVRIDPDVLDCSICFDPLQPPLFQCQNGHVMCSSCCTKLSNKCHICAHVIGSIRCLALEKVIESVKIPCFNARYGCKQVLSYTQRDAHKEACHYAPCFCPDSNCSFKGSMRLLAQHFRRQHKGSGKRFWYDRPFNVYLDCTKPFLVLLGQDGRLFLLLNNTNMTEGNAFSMICIQSSTKEGEFAYELIASGNGSYLQLKSSVTSTKQWMGVYPTLVYLLVPRVFFDSYRKIHLDVCIRKIKFSPSFASE